MKLQQSIYSKIAQGRLPVSIFTKGNNSNLQVLMYKNGKTYQIYEGTSEVDFDNLSVNIVSRV